MTNLRPGQYQIGNIVFGRNTTLPVETNEVAAYEVNAQDFQVVMSDEIRFGVDSIKPTSLAFTMALLKNEALENTLAYAGNPEMDFSNDVTLGQFMHEWRGDDVRSEWGELKPLLYGRKDGETVRIYGRPRKFSYRKPTWKSQFIKINAEYARSDTFVYSDTEYGVNFNPNEVKTINRLNGDAPTWLRFVFIGPMTHPIIDFGDHQWELNLEIESDEIVEVSSYPWSRRIVSSTGLSLAAYFISDQPYLDKLRWGPNSSKEISFTATGTDGTSKMIYLFREAWHSLD